ncbi:MAG TPA: C69 family dipeptidase [Vicinamibacterales bacterium]|jgi:dipeptidase
MRPRTILIPTFVLLCSTLVMTAGRQAPPQSKAMGSSLAKICLRPELLPADADVADLCDHCTSVPVGKDASADGGTLTTHSCDGHYEFQIHIVAGKKSPKGTMRPVMKGGGYGQDRPQAVKVGEIPEVEQTFTRYDASYSFMNEKQVGIGETTIGGRRELFNDEGWFDIMELERVALERASTAREAITIMGELAEKYGYGDGGECLTVIDPKEAWQFEIFGAGAVEKGAVWAAKRIPDGEVGVSANHSRISTLDLKDPNYNLASASVLKVAEDLGFWKKGEPFSYRKAYGGTPTLGSTRREWRVFNILAPSVKLDPWDLDLPFSVKPDKKVTPQDLMRIHRDSYEGTEFDMTKGPAAGPFGNPNRFGTGARPPEGYMGWERSISIFRCSYATVIQSRGHLPAWIGGLVWFAEDDPKTSVYMPLYAGATKLPESVQIGTRAAIDRKAAWWAFDFVSNWANLRWNAMHKDIRARGDAIEKGFFDQQADVEKKALELYQQDPARAREYLTDYTNTMVQKTVEEWWKFSDFMIAKYNDGYINENGHENSVGYPKDWLDMVGFGKTRILKAGEKQQ